jgi:hypothetical protein
MRKILNIISKNAGGTASIGDDDSVMFHLRSSAAVCSSYTACLSVVKGEGKRSCEKITVPSKKPA